MGKSLIIEKEVLQAEKFWLQAHQNLDLELLEQLMHPDYVIIQPDGIVVNKADALKSYQEGRYWEEASIEDLDIRVYGDTAVVVGKWQAKGTNQGQSFDYQARYISVWVKHEGKLKMAADQSTEMK